MFGSIYPNISKSKSILLSILIIGLGMFIYQQAAGAMSGANLDPQKANA